MDNEKRAQEKKKKTIRSENTFPTMLKIQEQKENCDCLAPGQCLRLRSNVCRRASERRKTLKHFHAPKGKTFPRLTTCVGVSATLRNASCSTSSMDWNAFSLCFQIVLCNDVIRTPIEKAGGRVEVEEDESRKTLVKSIPHNIFALTKKQQKNCSRGGRRMRKKSARHDSWQANNFEISFVQLFVVDLNS